MATKYNSSMRIPQDSNYIVRVKEEVFAPSNAGNPMITLTHEIVSPEEVEIAGEVVTIAGTEIKTYHTVKANPDDENAEDKNAKNLVRLKKLYSDCGIAFDEGQIDNPPLGFVGKNLFVLIYPDEVERRKAPTAEQLAKGQKQGDIMVNPLTKKPLVNYYPKIGEIFGLAPATNGVL